MKIKTLQFNETGPLFDSRVDFTDDWSGDVASRVLFSGPNGCGKSTVLRTVAMLWDAAGHWLDHRDSLPRPVFPRQRNTRDWLQRWGGVAMVLVDTGLALPTGQSLGLIFGDTDWCKACMAEQPEVLWLGESVVRHGKTSNAKRELFIPQGEWLQILAESRKKMILSFDKVDMPNVIFLDAEERRWVTARRNVGEHTAESPGRRWLPKYQASEDWNDQLEASLITLKTTQLHKYHEVIRLLNGFLSGKEIDPDMQPGESRLRVKLKNKRGLSHGLDDLSAGEHQVLIMLYLLARWAEKGTVVLIDEPDLYLHPSLVGGLLSSLENLVKDLDGQLIITSHQPEIWQRYEASGKRIELGAGQ